MKTLPKYKQKIKQIEIMNKDKRKQHKEAIVGALEGFTFMHTSQEIADKWEVNTDKGDIYFRHTLDLFPFRLQEGDNIRDLILNAFSWDLSPEGYNYWAKVDEYYAQAIEEWQNEALEVTETKDTNGNFEVN